SATVNGWTISTDGQTLTATRKDVLASGASFPDLTLNVAIASDAPASFTNTATVSGGGEINSSNNTASDIAAGPGRRRRGGEPSSASSGKPAATVLENVADAFTHSAEYLTDLVTQDYVQLLHRIPSAAEVASWVAVLADGVNAKQVLADFASSPEYYVRVGGSDS